MIKKFSEAISLLWRHLGLFTGIILTVWLPGNILIDCISHYLKGDEMTSLNAVMKSAMWIEAIFGPIYVGALLHSLFEIKSGRTVTYKGAMAVGFTKWGSVFAARFIAGILILAGLVALVVPGIVLLVRYSLLDSVVVLEGHRVLSNPRERSTRLTSGRRWQIFWSAVVFFPILGITSAILYLPLTLTGAIDILPVEILADCALDVAYAVIQIVIFLFYWEATANEREMSEAEPQPFIPQPSPQSP